MTPCEAPCPKCGSSDIYRLYFAKDAEVECKEWEKAPHAGFWTRGWQAFASKECIVHHCRTCQYEWTGKTLPKPKRAAETQTVTQEEK